MEPDLYILSPKAPTGEVATTKVQSTSKEPLETVESTIITLGDFIDTDALAPGASLTTCVTDEDFGRHCLEYTHPDFRDTVKSYKDSTAVVVAGRGFGVGSSRENAVSALKGCGVKCVISKSFAFIFGRNVPSLGLLGFNITDETFYEAAKDGRRIEVDVVSRKVRIKKDDGWESWDFVLSDMEEELTVNKGVTASFRKYGKRIWDEFTKGSGDEHDGGNFETRAVQHMPQDQRVTKVLEW